MSYIFRLHEGQEPKGNSDGWVESNAIDAQAISSIPDSLDKMKETGKVGTSIPTPFARVYLFKTAFEMVNRNAKGVYEELVSDCLDLLQFLFENNSDTFTFTEWDRSIRIQKLISANLDSKKQLGIVLNSALESAKDFPNKIVLIQYKGVLLGGTSPFSLVFTTPNLRRILDNNRDIDFTSNKNVEFCGMTLRSLKERPIEFQEYLYGLVHKESDLFAGGTPLASFADYVDKQVAIDDNRGQEIIEQFDNNNKAHNLLKINGVNIYYNTKAPELNNSDFLMKPSAEAPYQKEGYGSTPLLLLSKFDQDNWTYIDDAWNRNTTIQGSMVRTKPLQDRQLPKNGSTSGVESMPQKYPWLTDSDFLYDHVVLTRYKLNTEKFFNPAEGEGLDKNGFLLPIRKEYFMFFTLNDLKKNLRIEAKLNGESINRINVKLDIPLKGKYNKITIERTYYASENAEYKIIEEQKTLGVGIFPFYQLNDPNLKDRYSVYLFNNNGHDALKFYSREQTDKGRFIEVDATSSERSKTNSGHSRVYTLWSDSVSKSFDYIEASIKKNADETYEGLIVPLWPENINLNNEDRKAIFSIDFGTSNTHIVYLDPTSKSAVPFSIEPEFQQMVLLHAPEEKEKKKYWRKQPSGCAGMELSLREFVPSVIGDADYDSYVKYPIRTATLESADINNCSKRNDTTKNYLFEAINIGFNIDSEKDKLDTQFQYKTNLKWARQENRDDQRAELRVKAFCEQTLWMLKNMLVLKGLYSKGIQIIYYYPESMLTDDKNMFEQAWSDAVEDVFTSCGFQVDLLSELESVAPYYSLLKQDSDIMAYNSVNIDIGGGTTDIFFFDKETDYESTDSKHYGYEASVQFAGDDLWGAAYTTTNGGGENGFIKYQETTSDTWGKELKDRYENYQDGKSPADKASFFFKEDQFKFGEHIKNNSKLRYVLFLHYATIIYYLSDMIKQIREDHKDKEIAMPKRLTFTGKGSEYIKLIAKKEDDISDITWQLFKAYGLEPSERFEVVYPANPKGLTAEGGIYKLTGDAAIKFDFVKEESTGRRRLTDDNNRQITKYDNIGSKLLGFEPLEGEIYKCAKVRSYKDKVMQSVESCINAIFSSEGLKKCLKKISISLEDSDRKLAIERAGNSFDKHAEKYENEHRLGDHNLEGTIFFLAWKNSLIDLSLHYTKTNNKQ